MTAAGSTPTPSPGLDREAADRLQRKIDEIARNGAARPVKPKTTRFSENEINSYLAFNLREKTPAGLTDPRVALLGGGRLAGRVIVDLDEFKRQRGTGGFADPLTYVSGRVPLTGRGVLRTRAGKGRFYFESAELRGIPLPKEIVRELVSFFSRTPANPAGIDMDAPFDLPAEIREIAVETASVTVIQ